MTCIICEKIKEGKAHVVYEDASLVAVLPSKPAAVGHIKILPKNHFSKIEEMEDTLVEDLFFLANFASSSVFEALQAHGTNIILNETDNHLSIDVIPRKEGDNMNFLWQPKQIEPEEMDEIEKKISDKAFVIGKKDAKPSELPSIPIEKPEEVIKIPDEEKTNYLIKNLEKTP